MHCTVTGADIFKELENTSLESKLKWDKLGMKQLMEDKPFLGSRKVWLDKSQNVLKVVDRQSSCFFISSPISKHYVQNTLTSLISKCVVSIVNLQGVHGVVVTRAGVTAEQQQPFASLLEPSQAQR